MTSKTDNTSKHHSLEQAEEPPIPGSQTQTTQPPPCAFTPTTRLQALSVVTLAKMCIQHEVRNTTAFDEMTRHYL